MNTAEIRYDTNTKLRRITWLSSQDHGKEFTSLIHLFNEESLEECYHRLDGKKAVGVDGIDKESYGKELQRNLKNLLGGMRKMSYKPGPVREVLIPKEGKPGATRPLGISNLEDKIVQMQFRKILESIYEPIFLPCSYGFRPGKGCHDAIKALQQHLYKYEVDTVIDIDLGNFFGTIDHEMLMNLLREKIKDTKFMRYMTRMLKSGILRDGDLSMSDEGVPQGSICSPVLSNIYAHYAIDKWIQEMVKPRCKGKVECFRYADDAVICCEHAEDAVKIREVLGKRLAKFKLKLNEEKTKMVSFSKRKFSMGEKQGTFDFLGFTFYYGRSKRGFPIPKLKTSKKRLNSKLTKVKDWVKDIRSKKRTSEIWKMFCKKLTGHFAYYGVSHNYTYLETFKMEATRIVFKWLNRRSQRRSYNWKQFNVYMEQFPLPKAKIYHNLFT